MAEEISDMRVLEAVETGADVLVTMCPFCQASFSQSIEKLGVAIELIGVEELLLQSVED
jgi:Fe-S oxidoreductase